MFISLLKDIDPVVGMVYMIAQINLKGDTLKETNYLLLAVWRALVLLVNDDGIFNIFHGNVTEADL